MLAASDSLHVSASFSATGPQPKDSALVPHERIPRLREVVLVVGPRWVADALAYERVARQSALIRGRLAPYSPSLMDVFEAAIKAGVIEVSGDVVRVPPVFWDVVRALDIVHCSRCRLAHHERGMPCWLCDERA